MGRKRKAVFLMIFSSLTRLRKGWEGCSWSILTLKVFILLLSLSLTHCVRESQSNYKCKITQSAKNKQQRFANKFFRLKTFIDTANKPLKKEV